MLLITFAPSLRQISSTARTIVSGLFLYNNEEQYHGHYEQNHSHQKTYGPYTPVRQAGDTYYISGQVGVDPDSKTARSHVAEQVDQALKNLGRALDSVGLSYDDVVKTTLYLTNMSYL